jgi:Ca2+-binding EF-hand superfamily protein
LGEDFPKAEIDEIIAEATGGKRNQVSYAEFLRLWGEKKESERDKMIQELTELDDENKSVSSSEHMSDVDSSEARASFLGKKISSSAKSAMSESPRNAADGPKLSGLYDGVVLIPARQEADI